MILEELVFNPKYSPDWQERFFIPSFSLRSVKMGLNFLIEKTQFKFKSTRLFSYPHFALIDPSTICNLRCPLCPTGNNDTSRPVRFLKFEEYKKIMDEIGDYLISVLFTNWGEPFLNPEFLNMVHYAKYKKKIPFLSADTNLNVIPEGESVVKSGIDLLCISVDGATQETYEKYRKKGSLKKVIENTKAILKARKRLGKEKPFVVWLFLVFKHNEHEIEKIKEIAKEAGVDALRIAASQVMMSEVDKPFEESYKLSKDYLPLLGSKYSNYSKEGKKRRTTEDICQWVWKGIVINSDGGVSPCCAIFPSSYDFGNAISESVKLIWNNEHYKDARRVIKSVGGKGVKADNICALCTKYGNWIG